MVNYTRRQKRAVVSSFAERSKRVSKYSARVIIIYCPIVYFLCLYGANLEIEDSPWLLFLLTTGLSAVLSFLSIILMEFILSDSEDLIERRFYWEIFVASILFTSIPNYFLVRAVNELLSFELDFQPVPVISKLLVSQKHVECKVDVKISDKVVPLVLREQFCHSPESHVKIRKGILGLYAVKRMTQQ